MVPKADARTDNAAGIGLGISNYLAIDIEGLLRRCIHGMY